MKQKEFKNLIVQRIKKRITEMNCEGVAYDPFYTITDVFGVDDNKLVSLHGTELEFKNYFAK